MILPVVRSISIRSRVSSTVVLGVFSRTIRTVVNSNVVHSKDLGKAGDETQTAA